MDRCHYFGTPLKPAATLVMARIEHRSVLSYGYTGDHKLIRLVTGVLLGFPERSDGLEVRCRMGLRLLAGGLLRGIVVAGLSSVHPFARNRVLVGGIASLNGIRTGACWQWW
jgi:hypothetical protein